MRVHTLKQLEVMRRLDAMIKQLNELHTDAILNRLYPLANALMPILTEMRDALDKVRRGK